MHTHTHTSLLPGKRAVIERRRHAGAFCKPCPGTTAGYLCCGYQVLTPVAGCGMYCTYCVLQAYLEHEHQVVYDNLDDLDAELLQKVARTRGVLRLGTGEFADSLLLEPQTGIARHLAALLAPWPNVLVEFKTKSANAPLLDGIECPRKVVVGFSLNTERVISEYESGTATLRQRLQSAAWCLERGMRIAFHFDPMVYYPGCEEEYAALAATALDAAGDASGIAWWSMGGFRCMPALKRLLRRRGRHLPLFAGELIAGADRKYRYFRALRSAMYRAVREVLDRRAPAVRLYLCMESPEVWRDAGMIGRIPHGLAAYLDARAEELLTEER